MGFLSDFFGIDDDTKHALREVYLTSVYATELDYAERCTEEAKDPKYTDESRQTLRSESRGGYTEAYHAKQELVDEYGYAGIEVEEEEESQPWWKIW